MSSRSGGFAPSSRRRSVSSSSRAPRGFPEIRVATASWYSAARPSGSSRSSIARRCATVNALVASDPRCSRLRAVPAASRRRALSRTARPSVSRSLSVRRSASAAPVSVSRPPIALISSSRSRLARSASASSRKYEAGLPSFRAMCSSAGIAGRIFPSSIALTCARVKYGAPSSACEIPAAARASRRRSPSFLSARDTGAGRRRRVRTVCGTARRYPRRGPASIASRQGAATPGG